jgi:PAS domain S-box-containing protein
MNVSNELIIEELNSEKDRYSAILDLADTIIIVIDDQSVIRLINKKGCTILGYPKEELTGRKIDDFIPDNCKKEINKLIEQLFRGELLLKNSVEIPVITANNQERIIRLNIVLLRNKDKEIVFILCSGEDVTEKKKEEKVQYIISQILSTSNSEVNIDELFKFIHSSVKELMPAKNFYISLYDKDTYMIRFPYFVDEYDSTSPPKTFGKGLTEFVIRIGQSMLITEDMHKELENEGEIELIGSPSKIWLGVPLSIQNNIIGVMVVQDYNREDTYGEKEKEILEMISYPVSRAIERKLIEQVREELINKLTRLNESKDSLFSLISHDLRSPFNSLLGFSEILTSEYETLTHEEIKEYLNVIYESSKNLFGMTNNLLQFSRFQMGRIEFNPVELEIKTVVSHILNLLKGNTIKKQINVISSVPESIKVLADEDMLNSIFQNLISNAVKFTPRGGDIFISAFKLKNPDGNYTIEVVIKDTGVGIHDELKEKLFKDHLPSTPGTDREYGTGLGLLLVKEFVEKNGGNIRVFSKLGEGSTFTFTLPLP